MKDASTIERSFAMLKLNGVFERIGGLVLGKHEKFDDRGSGRMPYDILVEVMGDVRFPVLAQFDCCHTHPMLTLPIGSRVGLDADAGEVSEWSKVHDWKSCKVKSLRGFESPPLRNSGDRYQAMDASQPRQDRNVATVRGRFM